MKLRLNTLSKVIKNTKPELKIVMAAAGFITSTIMAVRATTKAIEKIEKEKETIYSEMEEHYDEVNENNENEDETYELPEWEEFKLHPKDAVRVSWKYYMPSVLATGLSIALLAIACKETNKKLTALATACSLAERGLFEYQNKTLETIGAQEERKIQQAVAESVVSKARPVAYEEVLDAKGGNTLCYDPIRELYFRSDANTIRQTINSLNYELTHFNDMYIAYNDFYYKMDLPEWCPLGDDLGWNLDGGLIEFPDFTSHIKNDEPCLVLSWGRSAPTYNYRRLKR